MDAINAGRDVLNLMRQVEYLDNIVENDHCAIKRVTRPMLNFKSFRAAGSVLVGIELIHMIRKGEFAIDGADAMSFADQFSTLVGMFRSVQKVIIGTISKERNIFSRAFSDVRISTTLALPRALPTVQARTTSKKNVLRGRETKQGIFAYRNARQSEVQAQL